MRTKWVWILVWSAVVGYLATMPRAEGKSLYWKPPVAVSDAAYDDATGRHIGTDPDEIRAFPRGTKIAAKDSTVYVTWVRREVAEGDTTNTIWFRRYTASAISQAESVMVSLASDSAMVNDPTIAVSPANDEVHIFYAGRAGNAWEIRHRWSTNDGDTWPTGNKEWVSAVDDTASRLPGVNADASGNLWLCWQDGTNDAPPDSCGCFTRRIWTRLYRGGWQDAQQVDHSSLETLDHAESPPACEFDECWFVRSRDVIQGQVVPLGSTSGFFMFGSTPWWTPCPTSQCYAYQYSDCLGNDPDSTAMSDVAGACWGVRPDFLMGKIGTWNDIDGRLYWWGQEDLIQGSDVRVSPRDIDLRAQPPEDSCELACVPSGAVPTSYSPLQQSFSGPYVDGCLAHSRDGEMVYTIFQSGDSGSTWESGGGPDCWARMWAKTASGWQKGSTLYPATRGVEKDFTEASRAAGADVDGWIHVVYGRRALPSKSYYEGDPPSLNFFRSGDRDIYYVTHHEDADPEEWGWEIPIVDIDTVGVHYAGAAVNDRGVHVLYSQYNPEQGQNGDLDVYYLEGEDIGNSVASGDSVVWDGTVFLDETFTVEAGGKLTIAAGTTVYAQTPEHVGTDPLVSLVVEGQLVVAGTAQSPVRFTSTRDSTSGEWDGILFDVAATPIYAGPGYGFTNGSSISYAEVENATRGITIEKSGAPSLEGVSFTNIFGDRHIILDSTDVYVPYQGAWNLTAPTNVMAANATRSGADIAGRTSGKVDLVVHGELNTTGSGGSFVYFQPLAVPDTTTNGDEWGGIFFDYYSSGSVLADADVGYAPTPVSLFYQDAELSNVTVHHFKDRGIWIYAEATGERVWVHDCTVHRDSSGTATLVPSVGRTGIVVEKCRRAWIESNTVTLTGVSSSSGGAGIQILNGKTFCSGSASGPDSLVVEGNAAIGPGGTASAGGGLWSGLRGDWACGGGGRVVEVLENVFLDWNYAGMDFLQGKEVQVSCNRVEDSWGGIEFSRNETQGDQVRFRENALTTLESEANFDQQVVRTDNAAFSQFGPSVTKGLNNFIALGEDYFFLENDEDSTHLVNAINNYWSRNGVSYTVVDSVLAYISKDDGVSDSARVDPSSPETEPSDCAPSAAAARGRTGVQLEAVRGGDGTAAAVAADLPTRTGFTGAMPSPARGAVELRFDLAGPERRRVTLEVFDVGGRRVNRLMDEELPGGGYGLSWEGKDQRGRHVGAGVYFVRLQAGTYTEVRKVVRLR